MATTIACADAVFRIGALIISALSVLQTRYEEIFAQIPNLS